MIHKENFTQTVEPITKSVGKKNVRYKCGTCGHIELDRLKCPNCNGGMFKFNDHGLRGIL